MICSNSVISALNLPKKRGIFAVFRSINRAESLWGTAAAFVLPGRWGKWWWWWGWRGATKFLDAGGQKWERSQWLTANNLCKNYKWSGLCVHIVYFKWIVFVFQSLRPLQKECLCGINSDIIHSGLHWWVQKHLYSIDSLISTAQV